MEMLRTWMEASWHILQASGIYMLTGFVVAGLMKALIPENFVSRHLGKGRILSVFKAAILGAPIPLCSCGVLPAAAGLRQQGANKGATAAFLVSTPETGVDSIAITYALLDPLMTVIRPVVAVLTAVVSGISVNMGDKYVEAEPLTPFIQSSCGCGCGEKHIERNIRQKLFSGWKFAFTELLPDIGPWFLGGVLFAGAISIWVTTDMVHTYFSNEWVSMVVMLAVAIPMYVCATASTPIAAALVLKGVSPGAALVFLMAGPATNVAGLTVMVRLLGKRATFIYMVSLILVTLACGFIVNRIYAGLNIHTLSWVSQNHPDTYGILFSVSAVVLLVMTIGAIAGKKLQKGKFSSPACGTVSHLSE